VVAETLEVARNVGRDQESTGRVGALDHRLALQRLFQPLDGRPGAALLGSLDIGVEALRRCGLGAVDGLRVGRVGGLEGHVSRLAGGVGAVAQRADLVLQGGDDRLALQLLLLLDERVERLLDAGDLSLQVLRPIDVTLLQSLQEAGGLALQLSDALDYLLKSVHEGNSTKRTRPLSRPTSRRGKAAPPCGPGRPRPRRSGDPRRTPYRRLRRACAG
jgi:hypothetical protein